MQGRNKIYTSSSYISESNVIEELKLALREHFDNVEGEKYLLEYRKGIQPVLGRTKEVRSDICHRIVVNNADKCVTFKNGYFMTKPAEYVSRREDETITELVKSYNEYKYASGKDIADTSVVDTFHTVGVAPIFVKPNDDPDAPYLVYALDPTQNFVAYSTDYDEHPVFACHTAIRDNSIWIDVITKDAIYRVNGGVPYDKYAREPKTLFDAMSVASVEPNPLGEINIVEYVSNPQRMGSFELALPIMDSINEVESMRADGIDQFIQSLAIAVNCEMPEGTTANDIRKAGMIVLKSVGENKADFRILSEQLDQTQTQVTLDDLYNQLCEVCALPSVNREGGGTSDNGNAVYLREGYAQADTYARNTADSFRSCNRLFDRIALKILATKNLLRGLKPNDFELKIEGDNTTNLLAKSQAGLNMKMLGLAPEIVFERTGLSSDPLKDVAKSKKYIEMYWNNESKSDIQVSEIQKSGLQPNENEDVARQ